MFLVSWSSVGIHTYVVESGVFSFLYLDFRSGITSSKQEFTFTSPLSFNLDFPTGMPTLSKQKSTLINLPSDLVLIWSNVPTLSKQKFTCSSLGFRFSTPTSSNHEFTFLFWIIFHTGLLRLSMRDFVHLNKLSSPITSFKAECQHYRSRDCAFHT